MARADAAWVADVIRQVEGWPKVSLRHTAAVEAARRPVRLGEVVEELVATFPSATPVKATAMLTEMVARRALITSLHAPSAEPDALGWLLEHLETAAASKLAPIADLVAELKEIHALLEQHNHAPTDQSRAIRADVAARMRRLARTRRHPVAVDLRLDASIVLPADVAREAERAALVLARVSAHPYGTPTWRDYHRRFYERFGAGTLVPLLEVVADSGIGWPDGYPGTAPLEHRGERSRRDETLLFLAQAAALDGRVEVVLDEPLIADLEPGDAGRVRLPAHLELCVRVHATHLSALQRGDFQLTVVSASRAAGVVTGRFLGILEPDGQRELAAGLTGLVDAHRTNRLSRPRRVPRRARQRGHGPGDHRYLGCQACTHRSPRDPSFWYVRDVISPVGSLRSDHARHPVFRWRWRLGLASTPTCATAWVLLTDAVR